jgi:hypothetical protein
MEINLRNGEFGSYDVLAALELLIERATPVLGADHPAVVRAVEARDREMDARHGQSFSGRTPVKRDAASMRSP